jgi:hypothetical protein
MLDPSTQQEIFDRARRLNDLRERLDNDEARIQQREKKQSAKQRPRMQVEREIISRLTEVLGQTNILVHTLNPSNNPNFNPRSGM